MGARDTVPSKTLESGRGALPEKERLVVVTAYEVGKLR
jgi:hypothetical protein